MITRRNILKALAAIPFVGWVSKACAATPRQPAKYGRIDACYGIARDNNVRCWLDGIEVTNRCSAANDIEGWADLFDNLRHPDYRIAAGKTRHYGAVCFTVKPNPDAVAWNEWKEKHGKGPWQQF